MKTNRRHLTVRSILVSGFAVIVLLVVVVAVALLDSPGQERLRRLDERRISDLREISFAVDAYWTREAVLPASLEELGSEERIVREFADPVTGEPYEYHAGTGSSYELCAVFERDTDTNGRDVRYDYLWSHGPSRQCFQLAAQDIDVIDR